MQLKHNVEFLKVSFLHPLTVSILQTPADTFQFCVNAVKIKTL